MTTARNIPKGDKAKSLIRLLLVILLLSSGVRLYADDDTNKLNIRMKDGEVISIGLFPDDLERCEFEFYKNAEGEQETLYLIIDEYTMQVDNVDKYWFVTPDKSSRVDEIEQQSQPDITFVSHNHLRIQGIAATEIVLCDINGARHNVATSNDGNTIDIYLDSLGSGIYLLRYGTHTFKFVKK